MTVQGVVLNLMNARRFIETSNSAQQPYEYTDVSNYETLVVHTRVLFGPGTNVLTLYFDTGMYRRSDCMHNIDSMSLGATDDTIVQLLLGKGGASGTELGKWLSLRWVCTSNCVIDVKAVGR